MASEAVLSVVHSLPPKIGPERSSRETGHGGQPEQLIGVELEADVRQVHHHHAPHHPHREREQQRRD